jgi:DNA-binding LacI/PurR family transcriptional regulator
MNPRKVVSSAEVARLAGVSRSAVSRAFTSGAYVSDETRAKVMAAAEALGYRPNAIARSLIKRQSGLIGIVTSSLDNPFYARLLSTLSTLVQEEGYGVLLVVADATNFDVLMESLLAYQVNGAILTTAPLNSTSAFELQRYGKPVVLVDRYLEQDLISSVSGDNIGGSRLVAELLVRSGHRRVAYIGGDDRTSSSRDRRRGFVEQLASHGLALAAEEAGAYSYELGAVAARRLLARTPRPDALFCANDTMAMGALEVARAEFGLDIPADLAIVGYDNAGPVGWPTYQLTTIDQNLDEMARSAIALLVRKLDSGDVSPEHLLVAPTLIERATTRPTAGAR